jgi:hypothetical protein
MGAAMTFNAIAYHRQEAANWEAVAARCEATGAWPGTAKMCRECAESHRRAALRADPELAEILVKT